jgi:site-specific DNA recombinase
MSAMTAAVAVRRVAIYLRVSSEDQAERGTIRTQADEVHRRLEREPGVVIVGVYSDEGVSGTVPLAERPAGARLLADARAGLIDEVWVYKLDRLGRDLIGLAIARRSLVELGVRLVSAHEGEPDEFMFDIQSAVAANERRVFLRRSAEGMSRAAREGRYTGGIVPFGYRVTGEKQKARLEPDTAPLWGDLSAVDLVRRIYNSLGLEGRSCRSIAAEFNALGIPTHYSRDHREVKRGERKERTQGLWRAGRIRNLVVNPIYKGLLQYGRRSERPREPIPAQIGPLVSEDLWQAAQETLTANRTIAKNTHRRYLLKGVIRCGLDGLTYVGSQGRQGVGWYRCGGQLVERGPLPGRCWGQSIRTDAIEPPIWADIETWLRNPGEILQTLEAEIERAPAVPDESVTLRHALEEVEQRRRRLVSLAEEGLQSPAELRPEFARLASHREEIEARLARLAPRPQEPVPAETIDLLSEVRTRLDSGLSDEQRQEIVRLLVSVVVHTDTGADGKKQARAVVEYRFPNGVDGVVQFSTGIREEVNYTTVRRVIELPVGRQKVAVG